MKSFREALTKKKLQDKFYKSSGLNTSVKSIAARGGSVTDRTTKGGSLLSKRSTFKQIKNSNAGVGDGDTSRRIRSNLLGNFDY